ncbi:hypothetical protein AAFN87_16515 [Solibacillus sp. CAU 1738]
MNVIILRSEDGMRKWLLASAFVSVLLAGCTEDNTQKSEAVTKVEAAKQTEKVATKQQITVFVSDEQAEYVEPLKVPYESMKLSLIRFIYDEVGREGVGLIDYTIKNNDRTLVLNFDDGIFKVQGSAGGRMFMGSLAESYFANFPYIEEIILLHNGSPEEILDHVSIGQPITRKQSFTKPEN